MLLRDSPKTWILWRRSVWMSGPKSLLQCVQIWSRTTGNIGPLNQILCSIFLLYQILISCNKMEMYLKSIQCDFLDKKKKKKISWGEPTMKITDLSILCKWETLPIFQVIKYLFDPLYIKWDHLYMAKTFFLFFYRCLSKLVENRLIIWRPRCLVCEQKSR